jgi:hypothetical protein
VSTCGRIGVKTPLAYRLFEPNCYPWIIRDSGTQHAAKGPLCRADSCQTLDARLTREPSSIPGLRDFLRAYPFMAFRPRPEKPFLLRGRFQFVAQHRDAGEVEDAFELEIDIPTAFPKDIPKVTETGGRIPRTSDYHVNQTDGTLCLGSPLRLPSLVSAAPTLIGFSEKCLIPYIFGISQKLRTGQGTQRGRLKEENLRGEKTNGLSNKVATNKYFYLKCLSINLLQRQITALLRRWFWVRVPANPFVEYRRNSLKTRP